MITRFSHATLYVLDHDRAVDFYVNTLGFKIHTDAKMDSGFRWVTITSPKQPDLEIILASVAEGVETTMPPEFANKMREILIAGKMGGGVMECDDCFKTFDALSAKGVKFLKEPTKEFYGVEAIFEDGCGNWFSLNQR